MLNEKYFLQQAPNIHAGKGYVEETSLTQLVQIKKSLTFFFSTEFQPRNQSILPF